MSRVDFATPEQVQVNFDRCLKEVVEGEGLPSDQGFDEYVNRALRDIVDAYPNVDGALVVRARLAVAGQLDGTNARQTHARTSAYLKERFGA